MHGELDAKLNALRFTELRHLSSELPSDLLSDSPTGATPISTSDELNQLNHIISQLQTRRALLLQHQNTQHSAIFKLPSEILAEVFVYANAVDKPSGCSFGSSSNTTTKRRHPFTPIRLGAVCTHWRHVAWNSPQLWTNLPVTGCWVWEPKFPLVQILNTYYRNMKAMTLDLFIDCFRGRFILDDSEDRLTHGGAFNAIFVENADKLRVLGLRMWPEEWLPHLEKVQETTIFSRLEEIWIKSPGASFEERFSFTNAPHLRKVELSGASEPAVIILPWTQITHLTLSDVPSDLCLKLFTQCTNLEHFRCDELASSRSGISVIKDRINFPHLKTFHYLDRELSSEWREAMSRYLQFPVLESIIWRPDWSGGVERQMIRQYPESIQTLEIQFRRRDQPRIKLMLRALNSLEQLKISSWPSIKLSVLDLLTPQKKRCLLPSLQKLHLTAKSNEMTPDTVKSLLTMVNLRRTLTQTKLDCLVLSYYVGSFKLGPWPPLFIEGIKELVSDGMKVVIEADNEEVYYDWLHVEGIVECNSSRTSISDISEGADPRAEI